MSASRDRKELEKLRDSRGWSLVRERMSKEVVDAAMLLGDNNRMTIDEIHFRRGAIWAAKRLLDVPDRLIQLLVNEEMIEKINEADDDAKKTLFHHPVD